MVAMSNVLSAAGDQVVGSWEAVHRDDRDSFGCAFVRKQNRLLLRGKFDEKEARAQGLKLGRRAKDGRNWSAFLDKLLEMFTKFAPLFIK